MTILELSTDLDLPRSGDLWHQLRSAQVPSDLIKSLSSNLVEIIMKMIEPDHLIRGTANELLQMPKVKSVLLKDNRSIIFEKVTSYWTHLKACLLSFVMRLSCFFANPWLLFSQANSLKQNKPNLFLGIKTKENFVNKLDPTSTPKKPDQMENLLCFVHTDDEDLKGKTISNLSI